MMKRYISPITERVSVNLFGHTLEGENTGVNGRSKQAEWGWAAEGNQVDLDPVGDDYFNVDWGYEDKQEGE